MQVLVISHLDYFQAQVLTVNLVQIIQSAAAHLILDQSKRRDRITPLFPPTSVSELQCSPGQLSSTFLPSLTSTIPLVLNPTTCPYTTQPNIIRKAPKFTTPTMGEQATELYTLSSLIPNIQQLELFCNFLFTVSIRFYLSLKTGTRLLLAITSISSLSLLFAFFVPHL